MCSLVDTLNVVDFYTHGGFEIAPMLNSVPLVELSFLALAVIQFRTYCYGTSGKEKNPTNTGMSRI